jgi:hypothetical protein
MIKTIVALWFFAMCPALYAQAKLQTYTSPDGVFQFTHSKILIHCTDDHRGQWTPAQACSGGQDGLCYDASTSGTVVCFAYPTDGFKTKPSFGGATFFVTEVNHVTDKTSCLAGEKDWLVHGTENANINGVRFKVFHISDAWTSGSQGGDMYRTFHQKKCYESGIQQVWVSTGGLEAGTFEEFTKADEHMVRLRLKEALDSFRFLK